MPHLHPSIDRAGCWFLQSGVQTEAGGVARYYRADLGQNARVSTEITGYAVSAFCYLYLRRKDEGYLRAALRAADFLVDHAWSEPLKTFPFEHSVHGDVPHHRAFFFDLGIIHRGLLLAWRVTGERRYLDAARKSALQMRQDFLCQDGFHPILELPSKAPVTHEPHWSKSPGCYQLKSAMSWRDLYEATGEGVFEEWYQDAVQRALSHHASFLPAPGKPEDTVDRLHAYCYFLEGLLPVAAAHPEVFRTGIDRVAGYLRDHAPIFERSDVYAQLLRVRFYASSIAGIEIDDKSAAAEAARSREFQMESRDSRICGGFNFGTRGGQLTSFINPVSTAFCLQADAMWQDRAAGLPLPPIHELI